MRSWPATWGWIPGASSSATWAGSSSCCSQVSSASTATLRSSSISSSDSFGHACQEELKIMHALVRPKFFIPVHGEQRHLKTHARLARQMGMDPRNIVISDVGRMHTLAGGRVLMWATSTTVPAGMCI